MRMEDRIRDCLTEAFAPRMLQVINESHRHAGHAGDDGSGESHFRVAIRAESLAGQTRLARHRAVHAALGKDILARIHALALDADG
jgi:BolA protein